MTYLSSNQLKQYEDKGFISPVNVFSKEKAKKIRNEIELIEKNKVVGQIKPFHGGETLNWRVEGVVK